MPTIVIPVINLQQFSYDCAMCGKESNDKKAVPFYCEPVSEGESDGGYASVCDPCYDVWEARLGHCEDFK